MPSTPLDEYVERLVDEAPPLTPEQADRLVAVLRHDPTDCLTCTGYVRWTEDRRDEAASYAARSGRRICDLEPVSR